MGVKPDREIIPGTELVFKEQNGEAVSASQDIILVPQPTNNKDDPLNWSTAWKATIILNQFLFVFISILTPLSIAPLTQIFMAEFHKTLPQTNLLFAAAAIVLGYAPLLLVPLVNRLGRRPVLVLCELVCVAANIWQARVASFPSFLAARVVSGIGAAANEIMMPMVISDLLFVHQRGRSMALYFWAYFLGVFVGPIIAGAIADTMGWRWFFWLCAILQGASLVFVLVAHPETKYERPRSSIAAAVMPGAAGVVQRRGGGGEGEEFEKRGGAKNSILTLQRQTWDAASPIIMLSPTANRPRPSESEHPILPYPTTTTTSAAAPPGPVYTAASRRPAGAPTRAQFSLLPALRRRRPTTTTSAARFGALLTPLRVAALPIVLWAALTFGFAANCVLALNLTESQVFAAPPYGFSPAAVGLTNLAFLGGAVVALATAGPLSDWVALRAARRNGGVLEPEMRLVAVVPYVAACAAGMAVTAVGYQRGWAWQVVVVVGYGLVGVEVVGVPAVVIAYALDSYKSVSGEIMIAATVIKNSFGFAMVFFYNDWAVRQGFIPPVLTLMAAAVGLSLLGLAVFIPFGKRFRRATKNSSLHMH